MLRLYRVGILRFFGTVRLFARVLGVISVTSLGISRETHQPPRYKVELQEAYREPCNIRTEDGRVSAIAVAVVPRQLLELPQSTTLRLLP